MFEVFGFTLKCDTYSAQKAFGRRINSKIDSACHFGVITLVMRDSDQVAGRYKKPYFS